MNTKEQSQRVGLLLVLFGGLILLGNTGMLGMLSRLFWGLLFAGGGAALLSLYRADRTRWWMLIPSFSLFGLAGAVLTGEIGGSVFLGLTGAGFAAIYADDRQRWWAVIPAGALFTLAVVAGLGGFFPGWEAGPVFFLGLAATFTTLYLLPEAEGRQAWALYPALSLLVLAALSSGLVGGALVLWPLALVATGAYLLWQRERPRIEQRPKES